MCHFNKIEDCLFKMRALKWEGCVHSLMRKYHTEWFYFLLNITKILFSVIITLIIAGLIICDLYTKVNLLMALKNSPSYQAQMIDNAIDFIKIVSPDNVKKPFASGSVKSINKKAYQ